MIDFTDQPSKGLPFGYAYYSTTFRTGYLEERNVCAIFSFYTFSESFFFFFCTARVQSSLNHTLFFLALLDRSGM